MIEIKGYEELDEIYHGLAGYIVIEKEFNIKDIDILNAIKYHTIGRNNMSMIEKIIYIADSIEEGRDYPKVDEIRKKTFENLEEGMIMEISEKLKFLKEKKGIIHNNTKELLDDLIKNRNIRR